jgi:hypothetical protein
MDRAAASRNKVVRTHNARLAISILENGLKDGGLAAAQKAAIAVLRATEPVPESVALVRFRKPGKTILKKARELESVAAACLTRG